MIAPSRARINTPLHTSPSLPLFRNYVNTTSTRSTADVDEGDKKQHPHSHPPPRPHPPHHAPSAPLLRRKPSFRHHAYHDAHEHHAPRADHSEAPADMALLTPKQRGLQRPSFGNTQTASSPSLRASATADMSRKASLRALTGQHDPKTPASGNNNEPGDFDIGDMVNVPGDMYGCVKFIGSVRGKAGLFIGVELDREFAARGKNSGDVDG